MILTEIGEIGVHYEGLELTLSPSLYAMSKIGSPREIVEIFKEVMGGSLSHSLWVIQCCTEEDTTQLFGHLSVDDGFNITFNEMFASAGEVVIIAQALMIHGLVGDVSKIKRTEKSDYVKEFHAKDHVANAVAHLGIQHKEAWNMTMTSLSDALRSKFPQPEDEKPSLTVDELRSANSWLDKVNEARNG